MKRLLLPLFLSLNFLLLGTPTPLFWTNCSTDIVATGIYRFNQNDFFTVFNKRHHGQILCPDIGLSYGLFTWNKLMCEVGIDYLGGADNPIFLNGKIGFQEDVLFKDAPAVNLGLCNVGIKTSRGLNINQNIIELIFGKSLPKTIGGRVFFSGYIGNSSLGKNRGGFMAGMDYAFKEEVYCDGTHFNRWIFAADFASGKNYIGGGGFGFTYYFTPGICLQFGPVFLNSYKYNGSWKWTFQFNANLN